MAKENSTKVTEKVIDCILVRAFHGSPYFQTKFLREMGFQTERFVYVRADLSVFGCDGRESDLVVVFKDLESFGKHFLFLIENKKSQPLSEKQPDGYRDRGEDYVANGYKGNLVSGYKTVLVSPANYSDPQKHKFDKHFNYEDTREWIKESPDIESKEKNEMLKNLDFAIENPGYIKQRYAEKTLFHIRYWCLANQIAPNLNMDIPGEQGLGKKGDWIYINKNPILLPHFYCRLWFFHKLHPNKKNKGFVDLQFQSIKNHPEGQARLQNLHKERGSGFKITDCGKKSISIRSCVPLLDKHSNDFDDQKEKIIKGIEAARELHLWALENVNGYRQGLPVHKLRQ